MRQVKISQLKNGLSRYLKAVRRGEEIEILDRDVPVAVLIASTGSRKGASVDGFFEDQFRSGILRRGAGKLPKGFLDHPPPGRPGALARLLSERREAR